MKIVNKTEKELTYTYESAEERNIHLNELLLEGYTITKVWGGGRTNQPLSATIKRKFEEWEEL